MKNFNKNWLKRLAIMHIGLLLLIFIVDLNGYIFQATNFDFTLYILMMCISFSFVMKESWIRWVITIVSALILTSIFYFFVNIHPQNVIKHEFNQMLITKNYKKMENLNLPGDMDYFEFLKNLPSDARAKSVYNFGDDESIIDTNHNRVVCTVKVKHGNKNKELEIIIEQVNIWQWEM